MTSKLSEYFWPPLFQTNRISRRINKLSENLTSLSIFTLKYHTLPSLFWAALILLRSKQRKYQSWRVYSPEQNGVLCACFASFQITFILKLKCSAFIRNTSFTKNWKGRLKNSVFVSSVRILGNILYNDWYRQVYEIFRDNWVRDVFWADNSKCSRARVARRVGTKCLFKSNK